jgi:hypothetical protein
VLQAGAAQDEEEAGEGRCREAWQGLLLLLLLLLLVPCCCCCIVTCRWCRWTKWSRVGSMVDDRDHMQQIGAG